MRIRIGLTQSDLANGYSSFDGYREGAAQQVIVLDVDYDTDMDTAWIAEQVFIAMNTPEPEALSRESLAGLVDEALITRGPRDYRSLSVGDTVAVMDRNERVACDKLGWQRLEVAA